MPTAEPGLAAPDRHDDRRPPLGTEAASRLPDKAPALVGSLSPERLRGVARRLGASIERWRRPPMPKVPYVAGETPLAWPLLRLGATGFVASMMIFLGATQEHSPFTLKLPGAWFFGIPAQPLVHGYHPEPGQDLLLGVVAVYGGMLLLLRAWYDVVRFVSSRPGIPVARLVPVFAAWVLPMLVVAPLFSRDAYAYAAQGEMMSHGINPYLYGTNVLGATPFSRLADPLWGNVASPYGPAFLLVDGWIVTLAGHNLLVSIIGLRLLALFGVGLFAAAIPVIARSFGRDGATAFALAALNPLVLLHLVAGAHNDALMLGVLAVGFALSRRGRPFAGIVVCGVAAAIKVPALIGAVYIGWDWLGPNRSLRDRLRPVATALIVSVGVLAVISETAGLGWGWIGGLTNPDAVRSWLDPATGLGLGLAHLVAGLGFGLHAHVLLTVARGSAFALAIAVAIWLLLRSDAIGPLSAIGWSLLAFVFLGPVVQPWYLSWGFVFLAPVAVGRVRQLLICVSAVSCFLGLPGGRVLVHEIEIADPASVAVASAALVAFGLSFLVPSLRRPRPGRHYLAPSLPSGGPPLS